MIPEPVVSLQQSSGVTGSCRVWSDNVIIKLKSLIYTLLFLSILVSSKAQIPTIGGYNVYYGLLHNHTDVSDGTGTPDDAYNYAKNIAGLDYFSISDHAGSISEAEWTSIKTAAEKYNEDSVFATFWGFEWSGSGDVTVINTDDYTAISNEPSGTFTELCNWLDVRNGLAFLNHPGRGGAVHFEKFSTAPNDKIVGMELFNKTDAFDVYYYNDGFYPDDGNLCYFAEANSRGWRIGASGSDDNHAGSWGTRTDYRMAILADQLSRPELFTAMQARRFYSTLDKNLALSFKIGASEMGSSIEGGTYDLQIRAGDNDGESFTRVMLFRNGSEMNTWEINTPDVDLSLPVNSFDGEFFYVKVTQADGDEAISSPIYIKGGVFNARPTCALSYPEDGTHFDGPQTIPISAEASDEDGAVVSVEFFVNGHSIGSDTLAPYSINYVIPANGAYEITAKATDDAGSWHISPAVAITVGVFSETASSRIAEGLDDVEENEDGSIYTNSSDIELVNDGSDQVVGLRFTGLHIPQAAVIDTAYIQFTVDEASSGACLLSMKGHNIDDSPQFSSVTNDVSARATTAASVIWEPPDWPTVGAAGTDQRSPDLSSIIQEIVNRPGYSQGSAISIIITGSGRRTAEAYEGVAGSAALLTVDYTFGTEASNVSSVMDETPVHIYPNPVSGGKIWVEIGGKIEGLTSVTVFNIFGKVCHKTQMITNENEIDLGELTPGIYILHLSNDHLVISRKLIVE